MTITSYLGVFYLRIFHYCFVYRNPIATISESGPMIIIVALLLYGVARGEKNLLTSFERIIRTAKKEKRPLTAAEEKKCLGYYKKFDKAVTIGMLSGFILGAGSTNILLAVKGIEKFNLLLFILFEMHAIAIAFVCVTLLIYMVKKDYMTRYLKEIGVSSVSNNISDSISLAFGVCIFLTAMNIVMVPIGLLKKPSENGIILFVIFFFIALILSVVICLRVYVVVIKRMQQVETNVKTNLAAETENLAAAAKETAAASQDQSAAVKEIVATMEDSNRLNANITNKIQNVAEQAEESRKSVETGAESIEHSNSKFQDIMATNQQTIDGIKDLSEKIENVCDIVAFINEMADQAKIIAFNAELEANSAGEAGKSFHIVASEVRRLSDSIIDGTKEIKQKIEEMQTSSCELINISEEGTEKINSGCQSVLSLKNMFASIENTAEQTANSSNDIIDYVKQLSIASEQIFITLKQIASGVENFATASDHISRASENVRNIAGEL